MLHKIDTLYENSLYKLFIGAVALNPNAHKSLFNLVYRRVTGSQWKKYGSERDKILELHPVRPDDNLAQV